MTYTYAIEGTLTYNEAETDSGFAAVAIESQVTIDQQSPQMALDTFLGENDQYTFMGRLTTCDSETGGKLAATFIDLSEDQVIDVALVRKTMLGKLWAYLEKD